MNALELYRTEIGLTFDGLAERLGKGKSLVWKHCKAKRIPAESVLLYESTLGIPRWMLRPDLWPAPTQPPTEALPPVPAPEAR